MLAVTKGEPFARGMRERLRCTNSSLLARARESERVEGVGTLVVLLIAMRGRSSSGDERPLWNESAVNQRHVSSGHTCQRNCEEISVR